MSAAKRPAQDQALAALFDQLRVLVDDVVNIGAKVEALHTRLTLLEDPAFLVTALARTGADPAKVAAAVQALSEDATDAAT
ncbi:MAG: hypothetical protein OXG81_13595 [Acidobacteria bacterium]|nr:hypothetical protein [Acidobacteriota bacterium]MCY4122963.1 hypothetical protein [Acidobacteriota bacterium]